MKVNSCTLEKILFVNLVLLFLLGRPFCYGQSKFTLHFSPNDFIFQFTEENELTITSKLNNEVHFCESLSYNLPLIPINILIENNNNIEDFNLLTQDSIIFEDVRIANSRLEFPTKATLNGLVSNDSNLLHTCMPEDRIYYVGTSVLNDFKIASFLISPFKYNVEEGELLLSTSLSLVLNKCEENVKSKNNSISEKCSIKNYDILESIVLNTNLVENDNNLDTAKKCSYINKSINDNVEYVIITDSSLVKSYQDLVSWKTLKGIKAKIATIQEIDSLFSSIDDQTLRIKLYLSELYQRGLKYAMLGGDTSIVPSRCCWLPKLTNDTDDTPSDMYFACFDKNFEWDANKNGIYGELSDSIDYLPEIFVSRLPLNIPYEVEKYVQRIIEYEKFPRTDNWNNDILMSGCLLYRYYIKDGVSVSDAQYKSEEIYENAIQPYYNCNRFRFYDTGTDDPQDGNYDVTTINLQNELQRGYSFVDVASHGWKAWWGWLENWNKYTISEATSLFNNGYTVITTEACYTNAFDTPDSCLSVAFLRNPNSGLLIYIGSSREGWVTTSFKYNKEFYKQLLMSSHKKPIVALNAVKCVFAAANYFNTYDRWLYLTLNPIGDPELSVYLSTPLPMSPQIIHSSPDTLIINSGIDNCKICISNKNNDIYEVFEGVSEIPLNIQGDEEYSVCITKQGYIPYICKIGKNIYVQNESFNSEISVVGKNIVIGGNITNSKPYGPVLIQNGKTSFQATGEVLIENDFEVKEGAELDIRTY